VDFRNEFVIPFSGLSIGNHQFTFKIDDKFFDNFEYSEIKKGNVNVMLRFEKQEQMLILDFDIRGAIQVICDRCLDTYDQPIAGKERLIVKFGEEAEEESDEIIIIPVGQFQLDVSQYIYEYINLLLPIRLVHPEDENGKSLCDPEVIKKLEELSVKKTTDSKWDILKNIKLNE